MTFTAVAPIENVLMNPILEEPSKTTRYPSLVTRFLVWTLVGVVSYVRYAIEVGPQTPNMGGILEQLAEWLTCFYPWLVLTPLLFRLEQRFPLVGPNWTKGAAIFGLLSLPLAYLAYLATILMDACVRFAFHRPPFITDIWWPMPAREIVLEQAIFWPTIGTCAIIRRFMELREKERLAARLAVEKSEIEANLRRSELELLRTRLNPHFLFNSLQSVSTLARKDPDAASQMLARLGEVLRAALRKDAQAMTCLSAEVDLTKAYVSVEEVRFAGRLSVLYGIDPATEHALVPSFLLQPLVENAMTHGLRGAQCDGAIWIRSAGQGDRLVLTVSDNGSGVPTEQLTDLDLGIGLGSTCERLERLYPGRHALSMRKLPEGGTEIRIVLPLEWDRSSKENQTHAPAPFAHRR